MTARRCGSGSPPGMTPDCWLNFQRMYDLGVARSKTDVGVVEPLVEAPTRSAKAL